MFFHLAPHRAVLNDTNRDLISAFNVLSKQPYLLHATLHELEKTPETYYALRAQHELVDPFDRAVRFFFLNRYCFNGIFRTNLRGQFNVPFASYGTGKFPELHEWVLASNALKSAQLLCEDFDVCVRRVLKRGDFVFLDPPYSVASRRVFSEYSSTEFGVSGLKRLAELMKYIDAIGATFVVTFEASEETEILRRDWASVEILARRSVAGFPGHRKKASEVVITNKSERLALIS